MMQSKTNAILTTGLIAGTLDVSTAILVYDLLLNKIPAKKLLQSIAYGIFREQAFDNGMRMAIIGLLIHFFIAFCFTIAYFFIYPRLSFLKKNVVISGISYGILVWAIMNLVVLPLAFPTLPPFKLKSAIIAMSILIAMIGLPIAIGADRFYKIKTVI